MSKASLEAQGPGAIRRIFLPGLFLALLFGALWTRRPPALSDPDSVARDVLEISGSTMGTTYRILIVESGLDAAGQAALGQSITDTLKAVNDSMSTYLPDSEISRFNDSPSIEPVAVSQGFVQVVQQAQVISLATKGAFDVTVAPLVDAWGFGPNGVQDIPSDEALAALSEHVGFEKISLDGQSLVKSDPRLRIDLSAIAKGWGVDQIALLLGQQGHADFLVEIGGEIQARGQNRFGDLWQLGIEEPEVGQRSVQQVVGLRDQAMATSGNYRNFIGEGAQRRSHTVDPRTSRPVTHSLASVSVITDNCTDADAWATALSVLGPEEGFALAESLNLAAFFLVRENGQFAKKATTAFNGLIKNTALLFNKEIQ
jgi:FAD:protein FMN transferase